jgi:hypothetical protein
VQIEADDFIHIRLLRIVAVHTLIGICVYLSHHL